MILCIKIDSQKSYCSHAQRCRAVYLYVRKHNMKKNLTELVKRLKKTGAKIIWASTTPVVKSNGILYAGESEI